MAGNGPPPKDKRSRDRDMKLLTDLVYKGEVFGDPLPTGVLGTEKVDGEEREVDWHPQTLLWWEALRGWPLMEGEPAISWSFMVDTAFMHHKMWTNGRWDFAAEIRLREAKYGIMPDDRKRLGFKYKPEPDAVEPTDQPAAGGKASVTSLEARRQRLSNDEPDEKTGTDED
ncbi:hypothetical protein GCM10022234_00260 [Aeromicrobium panaciterrae]|uniref:phage terminase small subunit n=1 Tax=Aeromicrobium panaciterrae TaxID=363861 RepID=UPI0031DD05F3